MVMRSLNAASFSTLCSLQNHDNDLTQWVARKALGRQGLRDPPTSACLGGASSRKGSSASRRVSGDNLTL